jgi:hypothetical protein
MITILESPDNEAMAFSSLEFLQCSKGCFPLLFQWVPDEAE